MYRRMVPRYMAMPVIAVVPVAGCGGGAPSVIPSPPAGTMITPITDIQGSGESSPLAGPTVTVSGIVSGDFQTGDADQQVSLNGFFVQQGIPDSDPQTSNGVFVFDGTNPTIDVTTGDKVTVEGQVIEYFGETRINAVSVIITGTGRVTAAALVDWLAIDPIASGDPDFLIIGDLNAHLQEDAVREIESGGYISLLASIVGKNAYSFQFQGQSGALDHAL